MLVMRHYIFLIILFGVLSCKNKKQSIAAQEIVDKAIAMAGGELYKTSDVQFTFRDMEYVLKQDPKGRILKRIQPLDSLGGLVYDMKQGDRFVRTIEGETIALSDSLSNVYANSINSVFYFALLPYGLNDPAVNKEVIGEVTLKGHEYYKIKVTFDEQGGGEDFDDVYLYWVNKKTWKPDYLAYEFHVNGGGMRFREAYNERYVNGIRFVDYRNYKPTAESAITALDSLFEANALELLSDIKLEHVAVSPGNYN
jgi:hypothetical protein